MYNMIMNKYINYCFLVPIFFFFFWFYNSSFDAYFKIKVFYKKKGVLNILCYVKQIINI